MAAAGNSSSLCTDSSTASAPKGAVVAVAAPLRLARRAAPALTASGVAAEVAASAAPTAAAEGPAAALGVAPGPRCGYLLTATVVPAAPTSVYVRTGAALTAAVETTAVVVSPGSPVPTARVALLTESVLLVGLFLARIAANAVGVAAALVEVALVGVTTVLTEVALVGVAPGVYAWKAEAALTAVAAEVVPPVAPSAFFRTGGAAFCFSRLGGGTVVLAFFGGGTTR